MTRRMATTSGSSRRRGPLTSSSSSSTCFMIRYLVLLLQISNFISLVSSEANLPNDGGSGGGGNGGAKVGIPSLLPLRDSVYFGIPTDSIATFSSTTQGTNPDNNQKDASSDENDEDNAFLSEFPTLRHREFDQISKDVELWAEELLSQNGEGLGWKKVDCNKALKHKFNPHGETKQWVKWMTDSRSTEHQDRVGHSQKHPCMKLIGTIDAPYHIVCRYLSQQRRYRDYNSLLIDQQDIEELSPHSKICWSQTKKLLFIQPRDFITFSSHRWLRDGTQSVVNQACKDPSVDETSADYTNHHSHPRAYALRGITYISKHPDDINQKTQIVMLQHCNCGYDIPEWAIRTAVNVLAPIKPFEIIHRINTGISKAREELEKEEEQWKAKMMKEGMATTMGCAMTGRRRSRRPAGIAQMGSACFWPDGGGLVEDDKEKK